MVATNPGPQNAGEILKAESLWIWPIPLIQSSRMSFKSDYKIFRDDAPRFDDGLTDVSISF